MNVVKRRRTSVPMKRLVGDLSADVSLAALDRSRRRVVIKREQRPLDRSSPVFLQPIRNGLGPVFAEELRGPVRHRNQAHDTFLDLDAAALPGVQVDSKGLSEAPRHVEWQRQPLRFSACRPFIFVLVVGFRGFAVFLGTGSGVAVLGAGLQRPQKEGG